jgi:hypothetical protein
VCDRPVRTTGSSPAQGGGARSSAWFGRRRPVGVPDLRLLGRRHRLRVRARFAPRHGVRAGPGVHAGGRWRPRTRTLWGGPGWLRRTPSTSRHSSAGSGASSADAEPVSCPPNMSENPVTGGATAWRASLASAGPCTGRLAAPLRPRRT